MRDDDFLTLHRSRQPSEKLGVNHRRRSIMGKIKAHEFITVDGVYESPSWTMEFGFDPKMGEALAAVVGSCQGLLLGRNTFEMFAPAWSTRTVEDDPGAPFFNESPKYVVSSAPQLNVEWNNSTLLGPYGRDAIRDLKDHVDGDLYVSGSGTLVRALLADGLLDELHLFVYPVLLGDRPKLFTDETPHTKLSLSQSETYDNGVLHLAYAPAS
jgi:dihydrofolate reductase